jgi:hypothetical protein
MFLDLESVAQAGAIVTYAAPRSSSRLICFARSCGQQLHTCKHAELALLTPAPTYLIEALYLCNTCMYSNFCLAPGGHMHLLQQWSF